MIPQMTKVSSVRNVIVESNSAAQVQKHDNPSEPNTMRTNVNCSVALPQHIPENLLSEEGGRKVNTNKPWRGSKKIEQNKALLKKDPPKEPVHQKIEKPQKKMVKNISQKEFTKMFAELDEIGNELCMIEKSLPPKPIKKPVQVRLSKTKPEASPKKISPKAHSPADLLDPDYNVEDYTIGVAGERGDSYLAEVTHKLAESYDRAVMQFVRPETKPNVLKIQQELEQWRRNKAVSTAQQT